MKRSLVALAVMAAAGVASAQSSVTLFGVVDASLTHGKGSTSSKTQLLNSQYNSSRVGFRGTEDLGGGMYAGFWLEMGMSNDDGMGGATNTNNQASGVGAAVAGRQGLMFNRKSTVQLGGRWGEIRLGRDYNPAFVNFSANDAFGTNGSGTTRLIGSIVTGVTSVRFSNGIQYYLPPNIGGFYGNVAYWLGENNSGAATSDDGKGAGIRLGFGSGPFDVSFAYARTEYVGVGASGVAGTTGDVKQSSLGGSWNLGVAKLLASVARDANGSLDGKGWQLGALIPVGPGEIRTSFSRYQNDSVATNPTSKQFALGYVHNLSKRTALYATYARIANSGGASATLNGATTAANQSSTGYDLGIRHSF